MMLPGLLLLLFSGRLNWQIRQGFLWLMLSMGMWVVKILKHLPPVWFIASAQSLQMPTLQRLPGPAPPTSWACSGSSNETIYTRHSMSPLGPCPRLLQHLTIWTGSIRGALIITPFDYLLCSKHQTQELSPLLPLPSLPHHPLFPPLWLSR